MTAAEVHLVSKSSRVGRGCEGREGAGGGIGKRKEMGMAELESRCRELENRVSEEQALAAIVRQGSDRAVAECKLEVQNAKQVARMDLGFRV